MLVLFGMVRLKSCPFSLHWQTRAPWERSPLPAHFRPYKRKISNLHGERTPLPVTWGSSLTGSQDA